MLGPTIRNVQPPGPDISFRSTLDVDALLNDSSLNARLILVVVVCALTLVVDGFDLVVFGFTAPEVSSHFGISRAEIGYFLSLQQLGIVVGGLIGGRMGDGWGRRRSLLSGMLLFAMSNLL